MAMKIGIPKNGEFINQHFGQSREFLIASVENGQITDRKVVGTESLQHNHAGLSDLFLAEGVSVVILGVICKPALDALTSKGLQVIRGVSGTLEETLQKYLKDELVDKNVTCDHHGGHEHHHH
jgi:predicted Fe-Mo cluster-binding NifX family protein